MTSRYAGTQHDQDFKNLPQQALLVLLAFVVFGLLVIVAYAAVVPGKFLAIAGVGIMTAGASLFIGGLFGFLFGIPRTATADLRQDESLPGHTEYRPNTNLEQISDWLTKILVGVGLTQIVQLPSALRSVSDYFERTDGLGTSPGNGLFALMIVLTYLICGFLIGYLWTYLFMRIALAFQEHAIEVMDELRSQSDKIAAALGLVDQQLNPSGGQPPIDPERLKTVIRQLPSETLADIFSRARLKRRDGWFDDKKRAGVARAIPVFEALIAAIDPREDYLYYSELGFALKDQAPRIGPMLRRH